MSKRLHRKFADTNSLVMGNGVGLAALEAMFNLVNTQSTLSAGMARDFERSQPLQMQSLARALTQIMDAAECGCCHPVVVDFPCRGGANPSPTPQPAPQPNPQAEVGAVPNLDAIKELIKQNVNPGGDSNTNNNTFGGDGAHWDQHFSELVEVLRDVAQSLQPHQQMLAVT